MTDHFMPSISSCLSLQVFKSGTVKLICPPSTEERELLNILHDQHIPAANIWLLPLWNLRSYFHLLLQLFSQEKRPWELVFGLCWEWEGIQKAIKSICFLPWPTDLLIPHLTPDFLFANFTKYISRCSVIYQTPLFSLLQVIFYDNRKTCKSAFH